MKLLTHVLNIYALASLLEIFLANEMLTINTNGD